MLDVDQDGWLMCAAVGDGDLMARIAKMTNSYRADKPGPTHEHDTHGGTLLPNAQVAIRALSRVPPRPQTDKPLQAHCTSHNDLPRTGHIITRGMEIIPDKRKVIGLIEQAHEGKVCLPSFQRDFVWTREEVADLNRPGFLGGSP
jgi:hypothetical protein